MLISLILMCLNFMKTGLFAIGGGLATIPFLYEISDNFGWFTHQDILNFIAISEATPGSVGVNMSTYAGFITGGVGGAVLATLSLVLPSFVVIMLVAKVLDKFKTNTYVVEGFHILRPASTALIAAAGFGVLIIVFFDVEKITFDMFGELNRVIINVNWISIIIFVVFLVLMRIFKKIHPLFFILAGAALGIIFGL